MVNFELSKQRWLILSKLNGKHTPYQIISNIFSFMENISSDFLGKYKQTDNKTHYCMM